MYSAKDIPTTFSLIYWRPTLKISNTFFCFIIAGMISFVALSIDTLLPAYTEIKNKFLINDRDLHWIITALFLGFSLGQILFGPVSDRIGRKNSVLLGVSIYWLGCFICLLSNTYTIFVLGRFIQGFGIGGPRVVSQAICRDLFSGNRLASINSFIMSIFILVPIVAPLLGQGILFFFYWKYIIVFFILFSLITTSFLLVNVEETLKEKRRISLFAIIKHFKEVLSNLTSMIYITCLGLLLGGLLTFINICQPLYFNYFDVGSRFPLYFALIASMLGLSSYLNSRYVGQFSAVKLAKTFSLLLMIWTSINLIYQINNLSFNLTWFSIFIMVSFSFFGFIFGNLNALAINPFGHIAGYASSVIGALSTFIALIVSGSASTFFDGTPIVVIMTLSICATLTFFLLFTQKLYEKK